MRMQVLWMDISVILWLFLCWSAEAWKAIPPLWWSGS